MLEVASICLKIRFSAYTLMTDMPYGKHRSLSFEALLVDYVEKYLKDKKLERQREGKDTTIISVFREGLFLWLEKEGLLEDALAYLKQHEQNH